MAAIIGPQTPEIAKALIAAATSLGLSSKVVETVDDGYSVPTAVASAYEAGEPANEKPVAQKAVAKKAAAKKSAATKPEASGKDNPDEGQE